MQQGEGFEREMEDLGGPDELAGRVGANFDEEVAFPGANDPDPSLKNIRRWFVGKTIDVHPDKPDIEPGAPTFLDEF